MCVLWIAKLLAMSTFVADGDGQVQIFGEEQLRASYHCTAVVVFTVYWPKYLLDHTLGKKQLLPTTHAVGQK